MVTSKTLLITAGSLLVVAAGVLLFVFNKLQPKTATSYEDAGGWVFECSRPIKVKDQGIKYMSGKPSLTPMYQSDADQYCHRVGIE